MRVAAVVVAGVVVAGVVVAILALYAGWTWQIRREMAAMPRRPVLERSLLPTVAPQRAEPLLKKIVPSAPSPPR